MIKINTDELDKFSIDIASLSEDLNPKVQKVLNKTGLSIEAKAKSNLTNNKSVVSGHLRRSIATKIGDMEVTVHTSNVKYSRGVEEGTRSHIIRPKNKKALYWKGAKHPVKQVNHPGSKAKPYLIPAFNSEKDKIIEDLKEVIKW